MAVGSKSESETFPIRRLVYSMLIVKTLYSRAIVVKKELTGGKVKMFMKTPPNKQILIKNKMRTPKLLGKNNCRPTEAH